jgi:hypothetical protein
VVNSYTYAELDFFRYLFGETGEVFQNGSRKLYLDDFRRLVCLLIGISSFILAKGTEGKYNFLVQLNLS